MAERLSPILPQVPVEDLQINVARSHIGLGDPAEAVLMRDGRVAVYARVRTSFLGIWPQWKSQLVGYLGPVAAQIITPALLEKLPLRLRFVILTPEHLAAPGPPEMMVSIWGDQDLMSSYLSLADSFTPTTVVDEAVPEEGQGGG